MTSSSNCSGRTNHTFGNDNRLTASTSKEKEEVRWTTAKIIDEFIIELALANGLSVSPEFGHTLIIPKYYERAAYLIYRIPLYKPNPTYEIELADLTPKLKEELCKLKLLDPPMFRYVAKMVVTCIFENIDFGYFHRSVMQHLKIRFVEVKGNA